MEMRFENIEKVGLFARGCCLIKNLGEKSLSKFVGLARQTKQVVQDDPRRVIHSLKVGLALTLVSLFYYLQPLYHNFGLSTMWAVMTVVIVFEFSVGATIGKGINRIFGTIIACALGLGAHHLANMTGKVGEPILIGLFVFLQAVASTLIRFFPVVKARYDYGLLIFILTFCFVSISGFRTDEVLVLAQSRISTIFLGASTCVIISIFIYPVWAGEDLHDLVANNINKLGNFLEGFGEEYFKGSGDAELKDNKSFLADYKSVLNSKNMEETLANFARWEPGHGQFMYRHPWKQYLKIGALTRQCACRVEALSGYLNSEIKVPQEIRGIVQETCTLMSKETGEAMKELAVAIRTMTRSSLPNPHITNAKSAARNLKSLLKSDSLEDINLLQMISVAAVASLLNDVVICVENIDESVNELASLAHFKRSDEADLNVSNCRVKQKDYCPRVIISVNVTATPNPELQSQNQDSIDKQDKMQKC